MAEERGGPLAGLTIVEFAGIGPGPFCGMMLADHGAEVIRIDRPGGKSGITGATPKDILGRSRKSVVANLKSEEGIATVRRICAAADGIIEGYRPGVMERLGLGPDVMLADNPKLVYGRMTGWGQNGPYAHAAGHDINYIALAGALDHFGREGEKPTPPINMVGDFGGGGMMLAFGMVSALLNVQRGGEGQVIDCAMTDGTAVLMSMIQGMRNQGIWRDERGKNLLDTGAHFYDTYECSDGKFVSIGSIEPQFYAELRRLAGLSEDSSFDAQMSPQAWPELKARLTDLFKTKSRAEWCGIMEATDVCFAPVLSLGEAPEHPHNKQRGTFIEVGEGGIQPAPAPRYSATPTGAPRAAASSVGGDTDNVLRQIGFSDDEIAALRSADAIG